MACDRRRTPTRTTRPERRPYYRKTAQEARAEMTVLALSPALTRQLLTRGLAASGGRHRVGDGILACSINTSGESFGRCTVPPGVGKTTLCYFNNGERKRMLAGRFADVIPDSRALDPRASRHRCCRSSGLRLAKADLLTSWLGGRFCRMGPLPAVSAHPHTTCGKRPRKD